MTVTELMEKLMKTCADSELNPDVTEVFINNPDPDDWVTALPINFADEVINGNDFPAAIVLNR